MLNLYPDQAESYLGIEKVSLELNVVVQPKGEENADGNRRSKQKQKTDFLPKNLLFPSTDLLRHW